MQSEFNELIKYAEVEEIYEGVWFAFIKQTEFVWALGDSKKEVLTNLEANLTTWLSMGKPTNIDINTTRKLVVEAYDKVMDDKKTPSKTTRLNRSAKEGFKDLVWLATCNAEGKKTFTFEGGATPDGFMFYCKELTCIAVSYSENDIVDMCLLTAAKASHIEEHHLNVFIEYNKEGFYAGPQG
jgi:predicted RNase H-like HicB family nuclease